MPKGERPCRRGSRIVDRGNGSLHILSLSAVAPRWDDASACDVVRDSATVVHSDELQTQVYAGGCPGGCEDPSALHVEHISLHLNGRVGRYEMLSPIPMRCGATPVEQTGCSKHIRSQTNGHEAHSG